MTPRLPAAAVLAFLSVSPVVADPPAASYIFPAGGRRGTTVEVRVGGVFLHGGCSFEMLGPGVDVTDRLRPTKTIWFEGPLLPLPESQQAEDYPRDLAGRIRIAADTPLGIRSWRLATDQGATPARRFVVGDLPEVVEQEIDGDPVPVEVRLPVTINGRIFPREDIDVWSFRARKGETISCEVNAARLGSPLDSYLEVLDSHGHRLAENDDALGPDSFLRFTAPADDTYWVRIRDVNFRGGQAYVYRLTLTADPWVDRAYPLGGRRGHKVTFELTGQGLPAVADIDLPANGPADYFHRVAVGGKFTNPFLLDLDDLPEYRETEPNDTAAQAQLVSVPAVLNGQINRPGDVDCWTFRARKGETYELDLRANRLGSALDGILTISDAADREVARAEALVPANDPFLRFTAPAEGKYVVWVRDRFPSRGGPGHAYRLRVDHPAGPDFRLRLGADAVSVNRGGQAQLKVLVDRVGGFAPPVVLEVEGLPRGVVASDTTIGRSQGAAEVTLKADARAGIGPARLTIRGSAKVGDRAVTRTAVLRTGRGLPDVDSVLLAVALPTPFKIVGDYDMRWAARGTVHQRHYRVERQGFDGPIEVSLADRQARHLQGVTGPTVVVPTAVSEFDYPVRLPPWMETGRTARACIMGLARIKDEGGREHVVSFSSVQQNEQVIVVVEPGRLGVEIDRSSLPAAPGRTVSVPVHVRRGKALRGPVQIELVVAPHIHGVTALPLEVPADRGDAILSLRFAADHLGPFNMPVLIRATVTEDGKPVVGEARMEILP